MRILMTAHTFYPASKGGVENHILGLAHYLMERGHEVGVFYRVHAPDERQYALIEDKWEDIPVFRIVHNFVFYRPNPYPFYDRQVEERFLQVLGRFEPDLVHVHHLGNLSTSLVGAAQRRGLAVVWTLHDFWPMCPLSQMLTPDGRLCPGPDGGLRCVECLWLRSLEGGPSFSLRARVRDLGVRESIKRLPRFARDFLASKLGYRSMLWNRLLALPTRDEHMRRVMLAADQLLSPSRFLIQKFQEWGIPSARFVYVQNGVPASLLAASRGAGFPSRQFTFGFIGSHHPFKGVHVLLDAFLQAQLPGAVLKVWGGSHSPQFQDYVASIREQAGASEAIMLEGMFPPEQIADVLRQVDVLVVPSTWYENNPLTILEAFAMGVPVIAGDVGGMAELVRDGENGLLFEVGNSADLAAKMRAIMNPDLLEQCRAGVEPPHSVDEMGAEIAAIYERLLASRRE